MKGYRIVRVFSLFLLFFVNIAFADNEPHSFSLTVGGGNLYFSPKRHIENTSTPLGILGFNFTEHWGVEALFGFFNTPSHKQEDNGRQVNGTVFAFDGVYHFSMWHLFVPYALLGPGVMGLSPNGTDANNEGNLNGGLGVEYFMAKTVALRAEFRDFYTFTGGKNDMMLDGGVTLLFG